VHVASRFADLLDTLARNLKPRLIRIAADGRVGRSRRVSNAGPTAPQTQAAHNGTNGRQQAQQQQAHAQAGATPGTTPGQSQQQWYNNMMMPNSSMAPGTNALYGISNDAYDLVGNENSYSIMPPPSFGTNSPNDVMNSGPGSGNYDFSANNFHDDHRMQDWLALPLDPLLNLPSSTDIEQTFYGPQLGGHDMLELLLNSNSANGFH
jgi:hypothetical protein